MLSPPLRVGEITKSILLYFSNCYNALERMNSLSNFSDEFKF